FACSWLKRLYRARRRAGAGAPVTFLYLRGQRDTLLQPMATRPGHFMPVSLLDSQLATLEPPGADERHVVADIEQSPAAIVRQLQASV
ncbi:MAG: gluconokinase, partial [Candidatus Saccharibacteria bacterium]|nr:gluconokinase [Pseudorhodobacter sp.]